MLSKTANLTEDREEFWRRGHTLQRKAGERSFNRQSRFHYEGLCFWTVLQRYCEEFWRDCITSSNSSIDLHVTSIIYKPNVCCTLHESYDVNIFLVYSCFMQSIHHCHWLNQVERFTIVHKSEMDWDLALLTFFFSCWLRPWVLPLSGIANRKIYLLHAHSHHSWYSIQNHPCRFGC